MKPHLFALVVAALALAGSCSNIPNTSIFDPIDAKTLAKISETDSLFANLYGELRDDVKDFNEIEKAKFKDITYRDCYELDAFYRDTAAHRPLYDKWTAEWNEFYSGYDVQADSIITFWRNYKKEHALSRYVTVEFSAIDKDYYTYSYEVKDVDLCFLLTPVDGPVQQVKFRYRYSAKINRAYGDWHNCITTDPFSSPVRRYWAVDYSDEKTLKNESTYSFLRDYDIEIEVTDVRKDGINHNISDAKAPSAVESALTCDPDAHPYLYSYYRDQAIKESLCSSYESLDNYISERFDEVVKAKFPRLYEMREYVMNK